MTARQLLSPYIEISLDNLVHNLGQLRTKTGANPPLMAVVKDRAYGCGARMVAQTLELHGIRHFAVARTEEARHLRAGGIAGTILVLGEAGDEDLSWGDRHGIHFALNDVSTAERWARRALAVTFHCNFDTGMGRLGIRPGEIEPMLQILAGAPNLRFEGAMTHFSSADVPDTATVHEQIDIFRECLRRVNQAGYSPALVHAANSAALLRYGCDFCTLARPGIALYGCNPDPAQDFGLGLRVVASLRGPVVKVQRVPAATPVSYGRRYATSAPTCIATVHLGYAHGLPRLLSNRGSLLIRGRPYPIAGTVTMDYTMVDLGGCTDVVIGDEAVAFGMQGDAQIAADEVALHAGTIGYEILCGLSASLNRYYLLKGDVIHFQEELLY